MITGDVLGERARLDPFGVALVTLADAARCTWGALDAAASAHAHEWTVERGLRRNDRVGVLAAPGSRAELELFFAAARAGLVAVLFDPDLSDDELAASASEAGLAALVHDEHGALAAATVAARLALPVQMHRRRTCPAPSAAETPLTARAPHAAGAPHALPAAAGTDPVAIVFTRADAGRTRGAAFTHHAFAWAAAATALGWQLHDDDAVLVVPGTPRACDLGVRAAVLLAGARLFEGETDPEHDLAAAVAAGASLAVIPAACGAALDPCGPSLAALRRVIVAGRPAPALLEALRRRGAACIAIVHGWPEFAGLPFEGAPPAPGEPQAALGRPALLVRARLVADDGRAAAPGEPGTLWVWAPYAFRGYWNHPEESARVLDAHGWFRPGLAARRDAHGTIVPETPVSAPA